MATSIFGLVRFSLLWGGAVLVTARVDVAQCEVYSLKPPDELGFYTRYGEALSVAGEMGIVGVPNINSSEGIAYVLERCSQCGWRTQQELRGSSADHYWSFGSALATDGQTIVVGALNADEVASDSGAVYVFEQVAGGWIESQKLLPSDAEAGDLFGAAVGVDGGVLAVGAMYEDDPGANSGAVYLFERVGEAGDWIEAVKIEASDLQSGENFGRCLAVEGNRVAVASFSDGFSTSTGAVYLYEKVGSQWLELHKLVSSDGVSGERFGKSIAWKETRIVIGADRADITATDSGAVYVFEFDGASWSEKAKLIPDDPSEGAFFGYSVSLLGDRVVVGAPEDEEGGTVAGAVYVFDFDGSSWQQTAKLLGSETSQSPAYAGFSVVLHDQDVMVGAPNNLATGAVYVFQEANQCPVELPTVLGATGTQAQNPTGVLIEGHGFSAATAVLVDGHEVAAAILADNLILAEVGPSTPGDKAVSVANEWGCGDGTFPMWPSLDLDTTAVSGTLQVTLMNGILGGYVLLVGTGLLPGPLEIQTTPETWYGMLVSPIGGHFLNIGVFEDGKPVQVDYPLPDDPSLIGVSIYLQGWCQQGLVGSSITASFTNVAELIL